MKRTADRKQQEFLPPAIAGRIAKRCRTSKAVVVVSKGGRASRVYDFEKYIERIEQTQSNKPWTHRKRPKSPDPLGAVEGRVVSKLGRDEIYD
jgi:hypothetical protein